MRPPTILRRVLGTLILLATLGLTTCLSFVHAQPTAPVAAHGSQ